MFCHYTSCVLLTFRQLPERALTPSVWFCALYEDSCPREALIGCVLVSDKFCDCLKGGACDIDLTLKVDSKFFLSMLYVTCFKTSFAMELIFEFFIEHLQRTVLFLLLDFRDDSKSETLFTSSLVRRLE